MGGQADVPVVEPGHPEPPGDQGADEVVVPGHHLQTQPHDQQQRLSLPRPQRLISDLGPAPASPAHARSFHRQPPSGTADFPFPMSAERECSAATAAPRAMNTRETRIAAAGCCSARFGVILWASAHPCRKHASACCCPCRVTRCLMKPQLTFTCVGCEAMKTD